MNNQGLHHNSTITIEKKRAVPAWPITPPPKEVPHHNLFSVVLLGAIAGGVALGLLAYLISKSHLSISSLSILSASGAAPATFVGAGFGIALGGILAAVIYFVQVRVARRANGDNYHRTSYEI
jgi:hypothetical protein